MLTPDAITRSCYPFTEFQQFPASCIESLAIGIPEISGIAGNPFISDITLSQEHIGITLSYRKGGSVHVLCTAACYGDGTSVTDVSGYGVSVDIVRGIVPESAYGTYYGEMHIDPSCIYVTPASVIGVHKAVIVDGDLYELDGSLRLTFSGLLSASVSKSGGTATVTVTGTADASGAETVEYGDGYSYGVVTSVNGVQIPASASGATLNFIMDSSVSGASFTLSDPGSGAGRCVRLKVNGDSSFPNCYGEGDEA